MTAEKLIQLNEQFESIRIMKERVKQLDTMLKILSGITSENTYLALNVMVDNDWKRGEGLTLTTATFGHYLQTEYDTLTKSLNALERKFADA